ncbi:uncharacterized protein LOC112562567 [Pomacea canaliculata]|uniref:uncharacterized protein LOC112562567 n=1 Tax=Pomacea canaliculata TaxID=400727 RepID=UPI000D730C1D|nr:uncharacterized protein LOC112562567 [Pomacea canaliculata]
MAPAWLLVALTWGSLAACYKGESVDAAETVETHISKVVRCKGSNLTLNEPDPRVTVRYVFRGGETLASASVPATGKLEGRLIVDSDGRVTLTDLKSHDLGTYGVEVQLAEDKRIHSIGLVVRDSPVTAGGQLFVMSVSHDSSIRLTCGNFTSLGFPPVSVMWKDPAGRTLSSDGFKDEYFYLDVPADTADSGDYCCQLDCRAPDFCCLDDQSPLRSCAKVHVQTKKVEVKTKDSVSFEAFSQLQQQVLHLVQKLQDLQDNNQQNSCQSSASAMAQLVHRQAKCDQLDTYITKIEALEGDIVRDIENLKNTTTDANIKLERETNQTLLNFQLQVDDKISTATESCNVGQQQIMTTVSDKLEVLETRLSEGLVELHNVSASADDRLETNMNRSLEHLQEYQLELGTNISIAVESFSRLQELLLTTEKRLEMKITAVSEKVDNFESRLNKDGGLELNITTALNQAEDLRQRLNTISRAADDHRSQSNKQIGELQTGLAGLQQTVNNVTSQLEKTFRQVTSDLRVTMTSNVQTLTNRTAKTEASGVGPREETVSHRRR